MKNELVARHFVNQRPYRLAWRKGRITICECVDTRADDGLFLAPALFDPQVNGYAGVDFQRDGLTEDDLRRAATALRKDGCARFLPTLITDEWQRLLDRLRHLNNIRNRCPELQAAIAGWHIEGPFLSAAPGFCGAHDPTVMRDPTPEDIAELRRITGTIPLVLTLAPERPGSLAAIRQAAALGIRISLGHTDANAETLAAAIQSGATGFTHLGNGCPRELNRHDNVLWRVLGSPFANQNVKNSLVVGMIPDRFHVPALLFRLLHRFLDPQRIYYTTDAMAAAASPPGKYGLGKLTLEVGEDQVVRMPGSSYFAGSALRPCQGVQRAAQMLGENWPLAWKRSSLIPAQWAGVPMNLAIGASATFALVKPRSDGELRIVQTLLDGAA